LLKKKASEEREGVAGLPKKAFMSGEERGKLET